MELLFEKSVNGRACTLLPQGEAPRHTLSAAVSRQSPLRLPALAEIDITRHYSALSRRVHGVNNGFYPLGSCTMKYNPAVHEEIASWPGFTAVHPLQPAESAQGCLAVIVKAEEMLCEVTGMDTVTFQPAAGAHGEFTGVLLIKAYHQARKDFARTKIIVPDSAHGTNPASAAMAGFSVVNIPSGADGQVDLDALAAAVGPDTLKREPPVRAIIIPATAAV